MCGAWGRGGVEERVTILARLGGGGRVEGRGCHQIGEVFVRVTRSATALEVPFRLWVTVWVEEGYGKKKMQAIGPVETEETKNDRRPKR